MLCLGGRGVSGVSLPPGARRLTLGGAKLVREMKARVKPQNSGDFLEWFIRVQQQLARPLQPDPQVVVFRAGLRVGLEKRAESGGPDLQFTGELLHVEWLVAVFQNVQHGPLHQCRIRIGVVGRRVGQQQREKR